MDARPGLSGAATEPARGAHRGAALRRGPSVVAPLVLLQPAIKATNELQPAINATNEAPGAPTPPRPRLSGSLPLDGIPGAPGSDLLARYAPFLGTPLFVDGELDFTGPRLRSTCRRPPRAPPCSSVGSR